MPNEAQRRAGNSRLVYDKEKRTIVTVRTDEAPPPTLAANVATLWQELLEKDDRTSPAEYPDMVLITFDEFSQAIASVVALFKEPVKND